MLSIQRASSEDDVGRRREPDVRDFSLLVSPLVAADVGLLPIALNFSFYVGVCEGYSTWRARARGNLTSCPSLVSRSPAATHSVFMSQSWAPSRQCATSRRDATSKCCPCAQQSVLYWKKKILIRTEDSICCCQAHLIITCAARRGVSCESALAPGRHEPSSPPLHPAGAPPSACM